MTLFFQKTTVVYVVGYRPQAMSSAPFLVTPSCVTRKASPTAPAFGRSMGKSFRFFYFHLTQLSYGPELTTFIK
jgi:hypothetical protein